MKPLDSSKSRTEYRNTGTHLEKIYVQDGELTFVAYSLPLSEVRYMTISEFNLAATLAELKLFHGEAVDSIEFDPTSTSQHVKMTVKRILPVEFIDVSFTVKVDT